MSGRPGWRRGLVSGGGEFELLACGLDVAQAIVATGKVHTFGMDGEVPSGDGDRDLASCCQSNSLPMVLSDGGRIAFDSHASGQSDIYSITPRAPHLHD